MTQPNTSESILVFFVRPYQHDGKKVQILEYRFGGQALPNGSTPVAVAEINADLETGSITPIDVTWIASPHSSQVNGKFFGWPLAEDNFGECRSLEQGVSVLTESVITVQRGQVAQRHLPALGRVRVDWTQFAAA